MKKVFVISVLLCAAVVCISQTADSEITKAMKEYKIIPDVITESVPELLNAKFGHVAVNKGNEITPTQARKQPTLDWNADPNAFYTVLELDPDAPSVDNPENALLNTWMVGNIPGKNINLGEVLFEYLPPATPRGVGFNRYAILVYKQPGKINFTEAHIDKFHFVGRERFPLKTFVSKYGLGLPVAGNFFRAQYDPYVLVVYTQLRCCFQYNKL